MPVQRALTMNDLRPELNDVLRGESDEATAQLGMWAPAPWVVATRAEWDLGWTWMNSRTPLQQ